jgi:hypothetical protein
VIAFDRNSICNKAQAYYYDYLCGGPRESIPKETVAHIDKCRCCQAEVDQLKAVVAEAEERCDGTSAQTSTATVTNLRLQFAYTGALVSCDTVRPFLPSLAIPALEVRVPTPITVHLDKCRQCSSDVETIRQLRLTEKQLFRLGQLFAERPCVDTNVCASAQEVLGSVGLMLFEGVSAETLRHLCICSACRRLLYEYREDRVQKVLGSLEGPPSACAAVSDTDVFDYVVPYGMDPDSDQYATFRESLTSHLINCAECLSKVQELHDIVYGILERRESGVVTRYDVDDRASWSAGGDADNTYKRWPINVRVLDKSKPTHAAFTSLKRLIRPAAVAAAIVLVAVFLLNAPVAEAIGLGQVYKALGQVKNACFTAFDAGKSEPTQKIWISHAMGTMMLKNDAKCVLWDVENRHSKSRDLHTGLTETAELDERGVMEIAEGMKAPWGLLPFDDMSEAADAKWERVPDENIEATIANTEVYDLMWMEKGVIGSQVHNKWRGYIDIETKLPRRIERWEKRGEAGEYELITVTTVVYPTDVEIRDAIRDAGF